MQKLSMKAARVNKRLSVNKLAQIAGVNEKTIRRWESGETNPSTLERFALAEIYGINVADVEWPERK